jgi:hypothetical protein
MRIAGVLALGCAASSRRNTLTVSTTHAASVPGSGSLRDTISRANPGDATRASRSVIWW